HSYPAGRDKTAPNLWASYLSLLLWKRSLALLEARQDQGTPEGCGLGR
ncbi:hypothetical protein LEMLEM_LOCUS9393, partial [Lemmus lemmus]